MGDIKAEQIVEILLTVDGWESDISRVDNNTDLRLLGMTSLMLVIILSEVEKKFDLILHFDSVSISSLYSIEGMLKVVNRL